MVLVILEKVPPGLRGELTRWMLEPKSGVFVGSVSGMVRERLWEKLCDESRNGSCVMIHSDNTEQGFSIRINLISGGLIVPTHVGVNRDRQTL